MFQDVDVKVQLTMMFGESAMRCNLISYFHNMLSTPVFDKLNDPLAGLVKTLVGDLLSLMLCFFDEDTLGDQQEITSIACKILSEPSLSTTFWITYQEERHLPSLAPLLKSANRYFPAVVCPYLHMLKSLCTSQDTADLVFSELEHQKSLTELFGKNSVSEIEACDMENVWNRIVDRTVLQYRHDSLVLQQGVYGKVLPTKQEIRLIRWTYDYSGWLYIMLQLNCIADQPMTYSSDSNENGITIATSVIELIAVVLEHDPEKIEQLEPLISTVFRLFKKVSHLSSPPIELLATCLKCIQNVAFHLPLETWSQLSATGFLPSKRRIAGSSFQLHSGVYGNILHQVEIPNSSFLVTNEYLNFLLKFFAGLQLVEKDEVKDICLNGLSCLELCHLILSPTFQDLTSIENEQLPSIKTLVKEGLLHHGSGEAILNVLSIGVDSVETITNNDSREATNVIQLVKLSFAVLNLLLKQDIKTTQLTELSSLEESLQQRYETQTSELDFIQTTTKVTLLSVIARYIYHQHDPKLSILSTIVLSSLAARFPLILTSCFGDALVGLRNAFANRLNGRVEALRLKIAIIEFLTTCVETQPGIVESFCHITPVGKDKTVVFGRFSCVTPIIENIETEHYFDVLSSVSYEFISSLWKNRYDVAMSLIKKSKTFWKIVTAPLLQLEKCQLSKPVLEVVTHVLNIVTYEAYYVKSNSFDEELSKNLQKLNGTFYKTIGQFLLPCENVKITPKDQLELLKSFKLYLTVMLKLEPCSCGLEEKETSQNLLIGVTDALKAWLNHTDALLTREMLEELADLCWIFTNKWKRSMNDPSKMLKSLNFILNELLTTNEEIFETVQQSLYATVLVILQEEANDVSVRGGTDKLGLADTLCKWLQFYGVALKEQKKTNEKDTSQGVDVKNQSIRMSVSLLNQITQVIPDTHIEQLVHVFKEHTTIYNFLSFMDDSIKEKKNLDDTELILIFLSSCSQKQVIAEHLQSSGIGEFLSLSIKNIYAEQSSQMDDPERRHLIQIWALVVGITARLLKILKHVFLESALDFIGTHKETIFQCMNVVSQLMSDDNLFACEQVSTLCYEIVQYSRDFQFALPIVFNNTQMGIAHMVRLSIALLGRQKLFAHLVECKAGDNIERLLSRAKTPSPNSFRSDSIKSGSVADILERLSPNAEVALDRLLNILSNSIGSLRKLTPNVIESILDEGMDVDSFTPLIDLNFKSPSLESDSQPSFGTLISCLNTSLKIIQKMSQSESDRTTPDKDFIQTTSADIDKKRSMLWFIIDNALIVLISQASCYLRHENVDERGKQFLKRELSSELGSFIHAVHRFRSRRGIPPSPVSLDKYGSSSSLSVNLKRSPSKLSTSFLEEEENSLFKLVDMYAKNLLR